MAHPIDQLNEKAIKKLNTIASYSDGMGLYLKVSPSGGKSWVFRYMFDGSRRRMGLGGYPAVNLKHARERRDFWRKVLNGSIESNTLPRDPLEVKREAKASQEKAKTKLVTFDEIATKYIANNRAGWSNSKHVQQWENTLKTYASPIIGQQDIAGIEVDDILQVLEPIWLTKNETATRLRGRIEKIIDYAKARNLRRAENPARWRGHLDAILAKPSRVTTVENFPSLPHQKVGAFMAALRDCSSHAANALEFLILTNTRTSDVTGADWSEIDLSGKLWVIPARRLKTRKEHSIPLSEHAVELLTKITNQHTAGLIFRNSKGDQLSNTAMANVIKRMNGTTQRWTIENDRSVVPHGFRSTFRVWAGERTSYSRELIEFAMAHQLKDKAEASYHRTTLPEKRRMLMEDWATRLSASDTQIANVLQLNQGTNK